MALSPNINDREKDKFGETSNELTYVRVVDLESDTLMKQLERNQRAMEGIIEQLRFVNEYLAEILGDRIEELR